MKKVIFGIAIAIVFLAIALGFVYYVHNVKERNFTNKVVKQNIVNNELISFFQVQAQLGGLPYDVSSLQSVEFPENMHFKSQTHHLILWIPEDACSACFMGRLDQLKALAQTYPKATPKFIFSGYNKNRKLLSLIAEMNIPIQNAYFIIKDNINLQQIQKVPILFILDSEHSMIKHPFVSSKNISKEFYDGYLKYVAKLYFQ